MGGDSAVKNTENAQSGFMNNLKALFNQQFSNQQGELNFLNGQMEDAINNPHGFAPAALAAANTNIIQNAAQEGANAQVAAQTAAAAHGGTGLPSGVQAQIGGQIAANTQAQESGQQAQLQIANAQQQQQNYWNAVSQGENIAQMENPLGYAGAETGVGSNIAGLSQAYSASREANPLSQGLSAFAGSMGKGIGGALGTGIGQAEENINPWF
jgi:hypothetical protein